MPTQDNQMPQGAAAEPPRAEKLAKLFQMYLDADKDYHVAVQQAAEAEKKREHALDRALKAKQEINRMSITDPTPKEMVNPCPDKGWTGR